MSVPSDADTGCDVSGAPTADMTLSDDEAMELFEDATAAHEAQDEFDAESDGEPAVQDVPAAAPPAAVPCATFEWHAENPAAAPPAAEEQQPAAAPPAAEEQPPAAAPPAADIQPTPTFDALLDGFKGTWFNKKGKINFRGKLPLVPEVHFNGQHINAAERRKGPQRTAYDQFQAAHDKWYSSTQRHGSGHRSKKANEKRVADQKAARRATATEAKKLIIWVTYGVLETREGNRYSRFGGDREKAFRGTMQAVRMAQDWTAHCLKHEIPYDVFWPVPDSTDIAETARYNEEVRVLEMQHGPGTKPLTKEFEKWTESEAEFEDGVGIVAHRYTTYDWKLHCSRRIHWSVICLEQPLDMNVCVKVKDPCREKSLCDMLRVLEIGKAGGDYSYQHPEVKMADNAFSFVRYLAWGYAADGHKSYHEVCDHTPSFGVGIIDIPAQHAKLWIRHAVQDAGITCMSDLLPKGRCEKTGIPIRTVHQVDSQMVPTNKNATWFSSISATTNLTHKVFAEVLATYSKVGVELPATTLELRQKHMMAFKDQPHRAETLDTIHCMLAIHGVEPKRFREFIHGHMFRPRHQGKEQPMLVGVSSSGKSRLLGALTGVEQTNPLLEGGLLRGVALSSQSSVYQLNNFCDKSMEVAVIPELTFMFGVNHKLYTYFCCMCADTAGLASEVHTTANGLDIPKQLCVLSGVQEMRDLKEKLKEGGHDWLSFINRVDPLHLQGGELPSTGWGRKWEIEKEAMSQFLFSEQHEVIANYADMWKEFAAVRRLFQIRKRLVYDPFRERDPKWASIIAASNDQKIYDAVHKKRGVEEPSMTGDSYLYAVVHKMDAEQKVKIIGKYYPHMTVVPKDPYQQQLTFDDKLDGTLECVVTDADLDALDAEIDWSARPAKRQRTSSDTARTDAESADDALMHGIGVLGQNP